MFLKRLQLTNFKNYEQIALDLNAEIVSLTGKNGMGKTNLLEAIHYLSFTKGAINTSDTQNIKYGEEFFLIAGIIEKNDQQYDLKCSYQLNAKKNFVVDKVPLEKMSDHVGEFPVVLITPNDTDLVREWSDLRRKFFDGLICQLNREYLNALIRYTHFLKQRNSHLKTTSNRVNNDLMDQYDSELVKCGETLWKARQEFLEEFRPVFHRNYQTLAEEESVDINYVSDFDKGDPLKVFQANRQKDILVQRTTFGVHKDDFEFLLGDRLIKKSGSQGQQKSFVISLRLAQYEILSKRKGFDPILLLDDIFDKLDDQRIERFTQIIDLKIKGQIFITDARPERTHTLVERLAKKVQIFDVEEGKLIPVDIP